MNTLVLLIGFVGIPILVAAAIWMYFDNRRVAREMNTSKDEVRQ
ncbi:MAG: hypothetical protein V4463_19730 [Pseudomonadota bacterium]